MVRFGGEVNLWTTSAAAGAKKPKAAAQGNQEADTEERSCFRWIAFGSIQKKKEVSAART